MGLAAVCAALSPSSADAAANDRLALGTPFAFSFDDLRALARRKAAAPYAPPPAPSEILAELDYQAWAPR